MDKYSSKYYIPTFSPISCMEVHNHLSLTSGKRLDTLLMLTENSEKLKAQWIEGNVLLSLRNKRSVDKFGYNTLPNTSTQINFETSVNKDTSNGNISNSLSLFDGDLFIDRNNSNVLSTSKHLSTTQKNTRRNDSVSDFFKPPNEKSLKSLLTLAEVQSMEKKRSIAHSSETKVNKDSMATSNIEKTKRSVSSSGNQTTELFQQKRLKSSNLPSPIANIYSEDDLIGCENFCRNAASTVAGFEYFYNIINSSTVVVVSLIFYDDLSTNHSITSIKHCTPSIPCEKWYCSCDRNVRADLAKKQILGHVLRFDNDEDIVYFIPLTYCNGSGDADIENKEKSSRLPIDCEVSLVERWKVVCHLFNHKSIQKIIYNIPIMLLSILLKMKEFKLQVNNIFDPKIGQYILKPYVTEDQLELEAIFNAYLISFNKDSSMSSITNVKRVTKTLNELSIETNKLLVLFKEMSRNLDAVNGMNICISIEMPLAILISQMESTGIQICNNTINSLRLSANNKIADLMKQAHDLINNQITFNLASPEQVSHVLYSILKLPPPSSSNTNPKKHLSTSEDDLRKIQHLHPIISLILEFRKLSKIINNNIDGLIPFIRLLRIHAIWNQTIVRTGRLSCCKPNLQNIPNTEVISGMSYNIRSIFIASPGSVFISVDYSQIEMRVLAHVTSDRVLQKVFDEQGDIYKQLASVLFSCPVNVIDDMQRSRAKTICLGIIYGMGKEATASKLGIDINTVTKMINTFFNKFEQVKIWQNNVLVNARKNGYVQTLHGRRRYLPEINSTDNTAAAMARRQAINTIIQGTASDIIKESMLLVDQKIQQVWNNTSYAKKPHLILQIHDELIYEIPIAKDIDSDENFHEFIRLLKDIMETSPKLSVATPVNIAVGASWGNIQEYKDKSFTDISHAEIDYKDFLIDDANQESENLSVSNKQFMTMETNDSNVYEDTIEDIDQGYRDYLLNYKGV